MRYDISLKISYEYDAPVTSGRQVLRLMPADLPGEQRLVSGRLDIEPPPEERQESRDFWNNATVTVVHRLPQHRIEYRVQARVERAPSRTIQGDRLTLEQLPDAIATYRGLDPEAPHHFRGPSPRVRLVPDISRYARRLVTDGMTVEAAVEAIGMSLHRDMHFDPEATEVDTPVEDAFKRKRGVCQDFTHVMIAGLRAIGIPAGYISGYLRTIPPDGQPRLEGADAMHAWIRAWCGAKDGWLEFDPTNGLAVSTDHVVVARGRDYSDIAPIRGILRTAGSQTTRQAADVVPVT